MRAILTAGIPVHPSAFILRRILPSPPAAEAAALVGALVAVATFLLLLLVLGQRTLALRMSLRTALPLRALRLFRAGLDRSPADLADGQAELAARDVHLHDEDLRHVADADARAGALAAHESAALVHVPPVVHQVLVA